MNHVLAVDQSTSGTKAVLFDEAGRVHGKATRSHRQIYPRPGWVEHDADEIYGNVVECLAELAREAPEAVRGAACLSLANQRETFVVFDRASGKPLHNAVVWQCRRGDPVCRELAAAGHAGRVKDLTGLALDSYFPAPKLKQLLGDEPDLRAAVLSGTAVVGTIDAYLVHRLTGGRVFATDHTNASRTLLFDIERLRWDEGLCELFGCPVRALPEVRASADRFGTTNAGGALPAELPICGVMGDSQAALFAQRAFSPGAAKVTLGTGSSVLLNVGHAPRRSGRGIVTTLGWVHDGRPTYAFEGIINCTGATVAWLRDQLEVLRSAEETEGLAGGLPDNGGVYLVPAFVGLGAPYWREDARGRSSASPRTPRARTSPGPRSRRSPTRSATCSTPWPSSPAAPSPSCSPTAAWSRTPSCSSSSPTSRASPCGPRPSPSCRRSAALSRACSAWASTGRSRTWCDWISAPGRSPPHAAGPGRPALRRLEAGRGPDVLGNGTRERAESGHGGNDGDPRARRDLRVSRRDRASARRQG